MSEEGGHPMLKDIKPLFNRAIEELSSNSNIYPRRI